MKPAGHVHALASTKPASDAEKGARHAEHAALPVLGLYVPRAHKVQTPALLLDPASLPGCSFCAGRTHAWHALPTSPKSASHTHSVTETLAASCVVVFPRHKTHAPSPAAALYLPTLQAEHTPATVARQTLALGLGSQFPARRVRARRTGGAREARAVVEGVDGTRLEVGA